MGKKRCRRVEIWVDGWWWTGKKIKEQKWPSKTIDIVSYALGECKWCHTCVCSPFHVFGHILKFVNIENGCHTCVSGLL